MTLLGTMPLSHLLENLNLYCTLFIIFPLVVGFGIYLTLRLRFIQLRKLGLSLKCLTKKGHSADGNISRFGAIASVLAGNFGTGNISGMAVALTTGGPGSLVWMWIMAFFGATIQYISCVLSVRYRVKNESSEYEGGPMYYLSEGLQLKKIAALFSLFTIFGALTVGNFAQINSVILPLEEIGCNPFWASIVIALVVAIVVLGGIERIASFASFIVPFKALLYLGSAFTILFFQRDLILPALSTLFKAAFDTKAFVGGTLGLGVFQAIKTGFDRGLFATDAGTGIVPILQASSRSENPVLDGIATLIAPFMVMIVCTTTGLVLMTTGAYEMISLQSTNMVTYAFSKGLGTEFGRYIVIVTLLLFAFTTILAWCYCGQKATRFLFGKKRENNFRLLYIALIPVGSLIHASLVWTLADLAISFMVICNMVGIILLSPQAIHATEEFENQLATQPQ